MDLRESSGVFVKVLLSSIKAHVWFLRCWSGIEKFDTGWYYFSHLWYRIMWWFTNGVFRQRIYTTEARIPENDPLRVYIDKVCSIIPAQFHKSATRVSSERSVISTSPTKEILVLYHKQVTYIRIIKDHSLKRDSCLIFFPSVEIRAAYISENAYPKGAAIRWSIRVAKNNFQSKRGLSELQRLLSPRAIPVAW